MEFRPPRKFIVTYVRCAHVGFINENLCANLGLGFERVAVEYWTIIPMSKAMGVHSKRTKWTDKQRYHVETQRGGKAV